MRIRILLALVVVSALGGVMLPVAAQWPQFRGPDGMGTAARHPPLTWSEQQNVRWKTAIHGRAWSSPVVLGDQVWVTTATGDGRELFAVALDRGSGKILHDLKLFRVEQPQYAHPFNTYASPTPVIEDGRVYVTFGSPGTAAIDTRTGKVLWERRDLECNHFRGAGSSPILFGNLLIMHFDGSDRQYVVALDKHTGQTVWRTNRSIDFKDLQADGRPQADGDFRKAFSTPLVVTVRDEPVLVSIGSKATYGYDPGPDESCGDSKSAAAIPAAHGRWRATAWCSTRPVLRPGSFSPSDRTAGETSPRRTSSGGSRAAYRTSPRCFSSAI